MTTLQTYIANCLARATPRNQNRFVRLLHLYQFPKIGRFAGIWETMAVQNMENGKDSLWLMRRVMIWDEGQTLGSQEEVPQWLIEEFGQHIDRPFWKAMSEDKDDDVPRLAEMLQVAIAELERTAQLLRDEEDEALALALETTLAKLSAMAEEDFHNTKYLDFPEPCTSCGKATYNRSLRCRTCSATPQT